MSSSYIPRELRRPLAARGKTRERFRASRSHRARSADTRPSDFLEEKIAIPDGKYRASRADALGWHSTATGHFCHGLLARQGRCRCGYCLSSEKIVGMTMTIDHLIPESLGGPTEEENLWLACSACNGRKGNRISARDPQTGEVATLSAS